MNYTFVTERPAEGVSHPTSRVDKPKQERQTMKPSIRRIAVPHSDEGAGGCAPSRRRSLLLALIAGAAGPYARAQSRPEQLFPDVVAVKVRAATGDTFDFDVTVSSPYDTPARYADAFRVGASSGEVFGERRLLHDHQDEQPFTRDLHGVRIPAAIKVVVVQARDRKYGYGGKSVQVRLPGR